MAKLQRFLPLALAALLAAPAAAGPRDAAAEVRESNLREVVSGLVALQPRRPGTTTGQAAARQIEAAFRESGLEQVQEHRFLVPTPVAQPMRGGDGGMLHVAGQTYSLAALSPNFVRLSAMLATDQPHSLVYAHEAMLDKLKGLPLDDAIVLLEFDTGHRWLDLAMLGAAAVVFIEPDRMERGEAQRKMLNVPLDVPRFYLSRADFEAIRAQAGAPAETPFALPGAMLAAPANWQTAEGVNILGFLPGSDPTLSKECLVVTAYYDSSSVVIENAPGAEQAAGIATMLETVRILARQRPQRSILFAALDGHFQALSGARALADALRRAHTRDRWDEARRLMRREEQERVERIETTLAADRDDRLSEDEWAIYRLELQRELALAQQDMALADYFYDNYEFVLDIAIDLSSGSEAVGVFHTGHFYADATLTRFLSPLGKLFVGYGEEIGAARVQDCITPEQDLAWDSWVPDQFATDAEPFTEAARPAISLFTIGDARPMVDTPFDTVERVEFDQLLRQAQAVVGMISGAANDPELISEGLKRLNRMPYKYDAVEGMIYEFERRRTFLPNTPVPHALVALKNNATSMMGVRPDILVMADARGGFRVVGYPEDKTLKLDAYQFEPGTGNITYAPDLGPEGEGKYPREVFGRQGLRRPLIVFPCQSLHLFDLIDERYFETLQQIFVYDARTDSEPRSYGYELPVHSPPAVMTGTVSASYVEPVAVIYAPRETRVKITMAMGLLGLRLILTNATPDAPEGTGFDPTERNRVPRTAYQAANDMWLIDQARIERQKVFGISSLRLDELHLRAKEFLAEAKTGLAEQNWEQHLSAARTAWAYEARAYPDVQGTEADTIKGVLFYLALLLPFAYFCERLLWGSPKIKDQILRTVGVFLLVYILLQMVHPAFQLLDTPWIILLGFIIMTLASLVITIVAGRFNEELEALKTVSGGQHSADVSRMSTLGAAFSLGISNMRRRPMRTAMTATTLVLLTFTVLSFTSVRTSLRANAQRTDNVPTYPGLLIRDPVWGALEAPTARILGTQFGSEGIVAPRGWLTSAKLDKQMKLNIANGTVPYLREHAPAVDTGSFNPALIATESARRTAAIAQLPATSPEPLAINAILGVTAAEPQVSGLGSKLLSGRWFKPGDSRVCILPQTVAERLDLGPSSSAARAGLGYGAVEVFGTRFEVIGVIEDGRLAEVVDLDGEPLTPVDFSQLEPEKLRMLTESQQQKLKLGSVGAPPIDRYQHFAAEAMIVLPYERLMSLGGTLRSVAVRFADPEAVGEAATTLMDRFELSAYAGVGDQVSLYSSVGMTSVSGLETVFIPLLIAALIVLNTMLGAVAERLTEIGIFSSLGLAPAHIAMLFLAEASVFANLGVIIGYLGGQTIAKILYWAQTAGMMDSLVGLSLNYSSTSTVGVAIVIIVTVLLSTLYPARKAAQLATPDIERRWRLPQPDGHEMMITLPFMLTGRDGIACITFLKEYFDGYIDFAGGDFYTDGTSLTEAANGGYRLSLTVWLAPYDLGVSQRVSLVTVPDPDDPRVKIVEIHLERISGDDNSWRRTNWLFVNILRQQFLLWRTIPSHQKATYAQEGLELVSGSGAPRAETPVEPTE